MSGPIDGPKAHASPQRAKTPKTLEDHGFITESFEVKNCPSKLLDMYNLILGVKDLQFKQFALEQDGKRTPDGRRDAAHEYDSKLKKRARAIATACNDPKRGNNVESEWIELFKTTVFHRFDREGEEPLRYHHCFVCRLHFPIGSRPNLNQRRDVQIPHSKDPDFGTCANESHHNLPNFDMAREVRHKTGASSTKPDLTIGLCTYNTVSSPWHDDDNLCSNPRVRLFNRRLLEEIRTASDLIPLYKGKVKIATADDYPQFPFAFWEAKGANGTDTHESASIQTALNLRASVGVQRQLYSKAERKAEHHSIPLAWCFTSVGSSWRLYGCHIRESPSSPDGYCCISQKLWDGDVSDNDQALRLLYMIDIIALWAEHYYKPLVGSCLATLEAKHLEQPAEPHPPDPTFYPKHIKMDRATFPWIFSPHESLAPLPARPSLTAQVPKDVGTKSRDSGRRRSDQTDQASSHLGAMTLNTRGTRAQTAPPEDLAPPDYDRRRSVR